MESSKNKESRNPGLNFGKAWYKIVGKNTFIPHLRSNLQTSIPNKLLNNFNFNIQKDAVGLFKIKTENGEFLKIKKLSRLSNSLGISLKAEKKLKDIQIEILDIKNVDELLKRAEIGNDKIEINSILPKYTKYCSWPDKDSKGIAPIYLFEYNSKIIGHSFMNKKEIIFERDFELDELTCSALGLYFAEGGKIAASFSNSSPKMISIILTFIEKVSNIKREDLKAAINCKINQKNKKRNLGLTVK